jgi:membrane fusion protein, multidrug efflux system
MNRIKYILPLLIVLLWDCGKREEIDSKISATVTVKTTIIRSGKIDETITVSGSTKFKREAQIRSSITGVITDFKFYNGDKFGKGKFIAQVRTKESQSAINGAEELLRMAATTIQIEEAQKALDLALKTSTSINLTAPFDGILSSKLKNELEVVSEGEHIASIVDPSSLIFLADIPTGSTNKIKIGQQATLRFTSKQGSVYTGIIHRIEPQANSADQTIPVQIIFTNPDPNLEGSLFGEATITVGQHSNALLVPKVALLKDDENNSTSLMLIGPDSLAHKIEVQVGLKTDSIVEVSSHSLSIGSIVITEGHYSLPDSTKVRIQN